MSGDTTPEPYAWLGGGCAQFWVPGPQSTSYSFLMGYSRDNGFGPGIDLKADEIEEVNRRAWERHWREEFERERRARLAAVEAQRDPDPASLDVPPS